MGGVSSKRFHTQPGAPVLRSRERHYTSDWLWWLSQLCDIKLLSISSRSWFLTEMNQSADEKVWI
jgi:hypothetical protein